LERCVEPSLDVKIAINALASRFDGYHLVYMGFFYIAAIALSAANGNECWSAGHNKSASVGCAKSEVSIGEL
jgi:hypothetical protein